MSGIRVLRVYHSAVVDEYRVRDRLLRSRHGYDLHVATPPAWPEGGSRVTPSDDLDVPVHIVPTRGREHPILFWYAGRRFREVLREVRPQIVDLHEEPYSLATAAALTAVRRTVPAAVVCLYTAQNIFKRYPSPFRQLERRALLRAAAAYPCSIEAGEVLRAKGFDGRVNVLPLGVTVHERPPRTFGRTGMRVGFLGRIEEYKGGRDAVDAFAAATVGHDAVLEVVGAGPDRPELERRAASRGIADRVSFTGAVAQDEALRRMATYDAVLVPSLTLPTWKEQFGRIPAQAMEAGTPVIAYASGSLPEVVANAGVLVPEGDVAALATALRTLLDDPARRAALSKQGRARASAQFSWERVADGFDAMYREVLAGQPRLAA